MHDQDSQAPDPLLGRLVAGKFRLDSVIGQGAMGKVYRAYHPALDKHLAIKVLPPETRGMTSRVLRFQAEARAASRLDHPNSVQIFDFGEDERDGLLYLAMEYIEGRTLQKVLEQERGPMSILRAAPILAQVLSVLAEAHAQAIIHRDVKPANVMLLPRIGDDGRPEDYVKVLDFGLAKIIDAVDGPRTQRGAVFGTPAYMSPEQARGEALDARTDLYAVGVMFYRMIAGRVPFHGDTPIDVLKKQIAEFPPPITRWVPDLPPDLVRFAERALEKDRAQRFQNAQEMRQALRALFERARVSAPRIANAVTVPLGAIDERTMELEEATGATLLVPPTSPRIAALAGGVTLSLPAPGRSAPPRVASDVRQAAHAALWTRKRTFSGLVAAALLLGLGILALLRRQEQAPVVFAPPAEPALQARAPLIEPPQAPDPVERLVAEAHTRAAEERPEPRRKRTARRAKLAAAPIPTRAAEAALDAGLPSASEVQAAASDLLRLEVPADPEPPSDALPPNFSVTGSLRALEVGGSVSRRQVEAALRRAQDGLFACVRREVGKGGRSRAGTLQVEADLVTGGRLEVRAVHGPFPSALHCIMDTLATARMPRPDTGESRLRFELRFETK